MEPHINIPTISHRPSAEKDVATGDRPLSLWSFIVKDKRNRQLLGLALTGVILQFFIFKKLYPFPDFFSDSYSYLFAAYAHLDVSIWPIGYSKFLAAFRNITYSSIALVGFQYFLLEFASLFFYFSVLYFYRPAKNIKVILFIFLFFNPLFLYLSNYVNSDPLFAALSLFWFTHLLWILHRPKLHHIATQAILLFLCFIVRNNAYYYPLIAILVFLLTKQNWRYKLGGAVMPFIFIIPFISYTSDVAYNMTDSRQFSLFTGWQLANNALYMRGHIQVDSLQLPTSETRALDRLASNYFERLKGTGFDDYLTAYVANYFIRQPDAPLKQYFARHYKAEDEFASIVAWGKASVIFGDYGTYLIKTYPFSFFRYFMLRNTLNYFMPPLEKLEVYNLGLDEVDPIAQYWFHFKDTKVYSVSKKAQGKILFLYPIFFFFLNLYFFGNMIWLLISKRLKKADGFFKYSLILSSSCIIVNFGFSIFATINVLRYQFFPMILLLNFSLLLMAFADKKESTAKIIPTYA